MNTGRINQLADHIEQLPMRNFKLQSFEDEPFFHMATFFDCGYPSCVGGWAAALFSQKNRMVRPGITSDIAGKLLGLDNDKADCLFYPEPEYNRYNISQKHAAACLRHLALTGAVNWTRKAPATV